MKIFATLMAALLLGLPGANAQSVVTAAPVNQDRTYQLLREHEDWSFLRDPSLREALAGWPNVRVAEASNGAGVYEAVVSTLMGA